MQIEDCSKSIVKMNIYNDQTILLTGKFLNHMDESCIQQQSEVNGSIRCYQSHLLAREIFFGLQDDYETE